MAVPSCPNDLREWNCVGWRTGGNLDGANRDLSALHVHGLQGILSPSIPPVLSTPISNPLTMPANSRLIDSLHGCGTSTILHLLHFWHQPTDLPCPDLPLSNRNRDHWGTSTPFIPLPSIASRHPTLYLPP